MISEMSTVPCPGNMSGDAYAFKGKCTTLKKDRLSSICNYEINLTFKKQVAETVATAITCYVGNACN